MNYTYQSFNMRGKSKIRPYYDLVANIAAEELGEIWNGLSAIDGTEREDGIPEGGEVPDLEPAPPLYAPTVNAEEIAKRL